MTVKGIEVKNIYYMLAYAFKVLREGDYAQIETEKFDNVRDLLGAILVIGVSRLIKRGLHKMYVDQMEDVYGLRGKIELEPTINHLASCRKLTTCSYDEFSVNNTFNRILKSTIEELLRTSGLTKSRTGLKKVLLYFSAVDTISFSQIHWTSLCYERSNQHYLLLMNICRFVIDGLLMGEDSRSGSKKIRAVDVDEQRMALLYEGFLRGYYLAHYPQLHPASRQIAWAVPDGTDVSQLPMMLSDVTLTDGTKVLILDAKFYGTIMQQNYAKYSYRNQHINQVLVYALNEREKSGRRVAAMLLYAKTGECSLKSGRWNVCGCPIGTELIDLGVPFAKISEQLDGIIDDYFDVKKYV